MSPLKALLAAASIAALCTPAFAQTAPDGASDPNGQHHGWHMPSKEEMAAWHARMCMDRYAREAGKLAYLQASLSITDAQRGAFDQWRNAKLSDAKARSESCLAHAPMEDRMHDALERNTRLQKMLETKLAELRSERPALEALYSSLTPEQKKLFDHADGHHGHHMHGGERFGEGHEGHESHAPG